MPVMGGFEAGAVAAEPARRLAAEMEMAGERGDAMAAQTLLPQLEAALMALAEDLANVGKPTAVASATGNGEQR
jgi:hypothetical protein